MRRARFRVLAGLLVAFAVVPAMATSYKSTYSAGDAAFDKFMLTAVGSNSQTVGFGSTGTPLANPSTYTFAPDGGSGVPLSQTGNINTPKGDPFPVTGKARVPNAKLAGAIFRAVAKIAFPIQVGMALWDLANELGYKWRWDSTQQKNVLVQTVNSTVCGGSTGCGWHNNRDSNIYPDPGSACAGAESTVSGAASYTYSPDQTTGDNTTGYCYFYAGNGAYVGGVGVYRTGTPVTTSTDVDQSTQKLSDAIAAKSGWPTTSAIAQAAHDAVTGVPAGQPVETLTPDPSTTTVTGPSTAGQPRTTTITSTNADGSTRTDTNTCIYGVTYGTTAAGGTVTSGDSCTDTVTNDGTTGKTTTTTKTTNDTGQSPPPATPASAPASSTPQGTLTLPCGLAGEPSCNVKVDETGMPDPSTNDAKQSITDQLTPASDFAKDPTAHLPVFPTLSWAFVLPTGCVPLDLGDAFAPYLTQLDVCQFMPVFHDLMTVVWVMGAIFGAIGTFWRSTYAAN